MPLVDTAVYTDGKRRPGALDLEQTFETVRDTGGFAWIEVDHPSPAEIGAVAREFDLHHLAVEDALVGHQRAKLERYGSSRFVVLRSAAYDAKAETVRFGELHVFVGNEYVITVRHSGAPDLAGVRRRLEAEPELLALGPTAVLYALLDSTIDDYYPVLSGLRDAIDGLEDSLFESDPGVNRRLYAITREVISFGRATAPLSDILDELREHLQEDEEKDLELLRRLRDVHDHATQISERVAAFRELLANALQVHATVVAQGQNETMQRLTESSLAQGEQVKRISSWAAILFAPTLIASIYGMNFRVMPELDWAFGYPFAVLLMVALAVTLYVVFKRRNWL